MTLPDGTLTHASANCATCQYVFTALLLNGDATVALRLRQVLIAHLRTAHPAAALAANTPEGRPS